MKETHAVLVSEAMQILGGISQSELARQINGVRVDAGMITQSTVWKWLNLDFTISVDYAVCIDKLTNGEVSVMRFFPSLNGVAKLRTRARKKAKRAAIKKKAA